MAKLETDMESIQIDSKVKPLIPPGKLGILVEWSYKNDCKHYSIIDANEVYGCTPSEKNLHTGQQIYVRRGAIAIPAVIVSISDDREFLSTELNNMRRYGRNENKVLNSLTSRLQYVAPLQNSTPIQTYERSAKRLKYSTERRSSSTSSLASAVRETTSSSTNPIPPMTFDQQTQTDPKILGVKPESLLINEELTRLLAKQEEMHNEIRVLQNQNRLQKDNTALINQELSDIKKLLVEMSKKIDNIHVNELSSNITCDNVEYKIIAESDAYTLQPVIEEKCPTPCVVDTVLMNQSEFAPPNQMNVSSADILDMIRNDWSHSGEMTSDFVPIGPNRTLIPAQVLLSINWNSASAATRKLLSTVFSRETLASHTLTGKPSPAFHGRDKPHKNQLSPPLVSDIIQLVSKYCRVPETTVRCSITTKCADENKMEKQRLRKFVLKESNKENVTLNNTQ